MALCENILLSDAYRFPGFRPSSRVKGIFGDPQARILQTGAPGGKNRVRGLWDLPSGLLRSETAAGSRSLLRRHAGVPGAGGWSAPMPDLWQGGTGSSAVSRRQPVLHKAICLLRGAAVPLEQYPSGRSRASAGMAYGQGVGQAVHAGAGSTHGHAGTADHWDRRGVDWKHALKWQRLPPFERFAALVERNWEGIAAYCTAEENISLGFVEGLNTKIRVIQRRAYGLRDEEYFRLKVLTCMLPEI